MVAPPPSDINQSASLDGRNKPITRTAPYPFDDPKADFIIRSSDNLHFYIHKSLLSIVSPVFEGVIALPDGASQELYDDRPCLRMQPSIPSFLLFTPAPDSFRTSIASSSSSSLLSLLSPLIAGLTYPLSISINDCGEYMWHALFTAKDGFSRKGEKGEDIGMKQYFGNEAQRKKLWEHTKETTRVNTD